jgi:hypothetical protein
VPESTIQLGLAHHLNYQFSTTSPAEAELRHLQLTSNARMQTFQNVIAICPGHDTFIKAFSTMLSTVFLPSLQIFVQGTNARRRRREHILSGFPHSVPRICPITRRPGKCSLFRGFCSAKKLQPCTTRRCRRFHQSGTLAIAVSEVLAAQLPKFLRFQGVYLLASIDRVVLILNRGKGW